MQAIILFLFGLGLIQHLVAGLQVTPGSACSALCLNDPESDAQNPSSSFTDPSEIACQDADYSESPVGIKYKNCMECLQKSNATSQVESDTTWYLYNARFTVDVCIYGYKNASKRISTPCDINNSCKSLKASLMTADLDPNRNQLEYCDTNNGAYSGSTVDWCAKCYANTDETSFLANFFIALKAGCEQRPKSGALLGLSGTIFTSTLVEITDPPQQGPLPQGDSSTGMTTGAIVGIAVGASLLFLGGSGLFFVYHRKQKRLYADYPPEYDPRGPNAKSITPPLPLLGSRSLAPTPDPKSGGSSIINHRSIEDMSDHELRAQHGYASNGAYYDQLEKEMQTRKSTSTARGFPLPPPPTLTIPTHPAYNPQTHSRQSSQNLSQIPSRPVKSNKPDSYALQTYLNAAEAADGHNPVASRHQQQQPSTGSDLEMVKASTPGLFSETNSPDRNPYRQAMLAATYSNIKAHTATAPVNPAITKIIGGSSRSTTSRSPSPALSIATATALSPPPPPPRRPSVPALALPSIPRIRVPKQYSPPQITIENATPVDNVEASSRLASPTSQQGDLPIGIQIGGPLGAQPSGGNGYYNADIRSSDDAPQSRWKQSAQRRDA